jgi:transketolase
MLQYALLHLFGYALSMDDIKAFRVSLIQASKTNTLLT